jgi:hypothetical protein
MDDATVAAVVAERVFGRSLSDADGETVLKSGQLLVFELLSGDSRSSGQVATQTFELYGYSKRSMDQASEAYDVAFDALQHSRLQVAGISVCGLAREVQRPVDGFNERLKAWFVRGRWSVAMTSGL